MPESIFQSGLHIANLMLSVYIYWLAFFYKGIVHCSLRLSTSPFAILTYTCAVTVSIQYSVEWVNGRKELNPHFLACIDVYFGGERVHTFHHIPWRILSRRMRNYSCWETTFSDSRSNKPLTLTCLEVISF